LTTAPYKCNRAANALALNSPHLLRKSVPKILKCRNFRGKGSEREAAGLACDADQNESTLMPKMMGFELSLKKIARSAKLQECSGMIPTTFTNIIE
jgi:hypothetical protein